LPFSLFYRFFLLSTRYATANLSLKKKVNFTKERSFSFSTGFLFVKKKKCDTEYRFEARFFRQGFLMLNMQRIPNSDHMGHPCLFPQASRLCLNRNNPKHLNCFKVFSVIGKEDKVVVNASGGN